MIKRFIRYEDMILRFAVDLTVPFTNNCAEERSSHQPSPELNSYGALSA